MRNEIRDIAKDRVLDILGIIILAIPIVVNYFIGNELPNILAYSIATIAVSLMVISRAISIIHNRKNIAINIINYVFLTMFTIMLAYLIVEMVKL